MTIQEGYSPSNAEAWKRENIVQKPMPSQPRLFLVCAISSADRETIRAADEVMVFGDDDIQEDHDEEIAKAKAEKQLAEAEYIARPYLVLANESREAERYVEYDLRENLCVNPYLVIDTGLAADKVEGIRGDRVFGDIAGEMIRLDQISILTKWNGQVLSDYLQLFISAFSDEE
ncbi:MAG: hypothetical protein IT426_10825 [Pirellulales bacterium]|nr:hypothetical protein [Pirellulales bacterium]